MILKPSDAYTAQFTTQHPETGLASDADTLPTAIATRNGTDDTTFILTITNMATGRYKITGTIPATYSSADIIQIVVEATVNEIEATAIVDQFVIETKRISDLNDFDVASQTVIIDNTFTDNIQDIKTTLDATDFSTLVNLDQAISTRSTFDPATQNVTVDDITPNVLAEFLTTNTGTTFSSAVTGSVAKEIVDNVATNSGTSDWTITELSQIRHRLGIDGDTQTPSSTIGDLADIKTILQASTHK